MPLSYSLFPLPLLALWMELRIGGSKGENHGLQLEPMAGKSNELSKQTNSKSNNITMIYTEIIYTESPRQNTNQLFPTTLSPTGRDTLLFQSKSTLPPLLEMT